MSNFFPSGLNTTVGTDAFRSGWINDRTRRDDTGSALDPALGIATVTAWVVGATRPSGQPLSEIERHYIEETLELTQGNREEAARMLGIGERTLYRKIQDWKEEDRIRSALAEHHGDVRETAKALEMDEAGLAREMKKLGLAEQG